MMPPRLRSATQRPATGYDTLQRRLTRTIERTDLNAVVPKVARRTRARCSDLTRALPWPAALGIAAVLVLVAAAFVGLAGTDSVGPGKVGTGTVDDARPVSLQVSGGIGAGDSSVHGPTEFTDPDAGSADQTRNPLSQLADAFTGTGGGSTSSSATAAGTTSDNPRAQPRPPARAESGVPAGTLTSPGAKELFRATNADRVANGLEPLLLDTSLNHSAQLHADWMAANGVLCHSSECDNAGEPDLSVWNGWAENIAYSVSPEVNVLQKEFLESPPHRANVLDPRHHYIGLGWTAGRLAGTDRVAVFVVVQFGMQKQ